MDRMGSTSRGLGTAVHRRGSIEQSSQSNNPHSANASDLSCPRCSSYFKSPLMMPGCSHRVCKRCVRYLYKRSKDSYFHCPVCNQLCASAPDSLRTDRDLEDKVRQHLRSHPGRRGSETRRISCQKSNCNAEADGNEPCPHCQLHLCREHFEEDCELVNQFCDDQLAEGEQMVLELQDYVENCKLQKRNINSLIEDNDRTREQLVTYIETQFKNMQKELLTSRNNVEAAESKIKNVLDQACELLEDIRRSLKVEEDDFKTLKEKHELASEAERLENSIKLPRLPADVRFNFTTADTEAIEEKIKKLKVIQNSLEVHVTDKQSVECSEGKLKFPNKDLQEQYEKLRPHNAVLWSHTKDFCLTTDYLVQRKNASCGVSSNASTLPAEVLIVSDMMKLHVLSLDGEWLGQIKVNDGATPIITTCRYLSVSPNGKQLALLSHEKVLLCDMDGTKIKEIQPDHDVQKKFHGLCSVTLSEKYLMIVAPGNTCHRKPGAVFILKGPEFDFSQAKEIPLDHRRIFPTGVTHLRGSIFVLANRISVDVGREVAFNELLMYDRDSCEFVAEMPCSDEIHSALYICSDDSGRVFVSVSCNQRDNQTRSSYAEVIILDPQGRRIGTIGADKELATCNGISISDSRAKSGSQNRLVVCDATQRLVVVYTLG